MMTKPRKTMFAPKSDDASGSAPQKPLPNAVTDAGAVQVTIPVISSREWQDRFIPAIEAKVADAQRRKAEAEEQRTVSEMSSLFGKASASQLVVEAREAVRLVEIEIEGLQSVLQRAHGEKEAALNREADAAADAETYRAQKIAREQIELARKFDQHLAALAALAEQFWKNVNALSPLTQRHGFGRERLINSYAFRAAVRAAGQGLYKLLDLDEMPPEQRAPLGATEARKYDRLLSLETVAGNAEKHRNEIIDEVEAEHPELVPNLDQDSEAEVDRKMTRLEELVAERLVAEGLRAA